MSKRTHTGAHLYERFDTRSGKALYKCMIPGCPHYISKGELIIGRLSRCWGECGREAVITKDVYQDKIKKPYCETCRQERKEAREAMASVRVEDV